MDIDLAREHIVSMKDAARHVPGRPHVATLHRWSARRINPLETIRVGGRHYTSLEAIQRFIQGCSEPTVQLLSRVPTPRPQTLAEVNEHLRAEGII